MKLLLRRLAAKILGSEPRDVGASPTVTAIEPVGSFYLQPGPCPKSPFKDDRHVWEGYRIEYCRNCGMYRIETIPKTVYFRL